MATERLKTVKPSGGDYTSLAAAIAGEAGNLVSADEWLHISCYAMTDTTQATVTGYTTSADCYILIDTPISERHKGIFDKNNYYYMRRNGGGGALQILQSYVTVEGVQAENVQTYASRAALSVGEPFVGIKLSKCIGVCATYAAFSFLASVIEVFNCLSVNSREGFFFRTNSKLYNCTAANCVQGFVNAYGSAAIYNCLAANCSTADFAREGSPVFTLNNCASSDGTAANFAGSGNRTNQTFSFVDAANGDFHLAENDTGARGYGLTNPGSGLYLDDIDGETRTVPWDIGADQYVGGGPSPTSKNRQYFYFQNMRG